MSHALTTSYVEVFQFRLQFLRDCAITEGEFLLNLIVFALTGCAERVGNIGVHSLCGGDDGSVLRKRGMYME